jgi:hypothetical protein
MAIEHPSLDTRTFRDIVQHILGDPTAGITGLRQAYTPEWKSHLADDPGVVLAMLFGKLMEIVLRRLNRVPEKHFIAFLNLLGIDRLPGNPARTPVQFALPAGNASGGFVPAGTQLATGTTESGSVHIFETEKAFFLTPVRLQSIFALLPSADTYTDLSFLANTSTEEDIPVLSGETLIEHSLYLAHNELLAFSEPVDLSLEITLAQTSPPFLPDDLDWHVTWQRYVVDEEGKGEWQDIELETSPPPTGAAQLLESGEVVFQNFPGTGRSLQGTPEAGGGEAHWIRAILRTPLVDALPLPRIEALTLRVHIAREASIDAAFFNSIPLDLSKDFYPFGEEPKFANTFYLASNAAFSKPGARITLRMELSEAILGEDPPVTPSSDLQLRWETWDGKRWVPLEVADTSQNLSIGTNSSPPGGDISLTLPAHVEAREENGVTSYWVRSRILRGNYGRPAQYQPVLGTSPTEYQFVPADVHPPILGRMTLRYEADFPPADRPPAVPEKCLTLNNFVYQDHRTSLMTAEGFLPFAPVPEVESAVYFGFDQTFGDRAISLFVHITDKAEDGTRETPTASLTTQSERSPQAIWEYSNRVGSWSRLEVEDGTEHLTTSGTVSFIGPVDFAKAGQFGKQLFWLRARFQADVTPRDARVKGVYTNTVWAVNQTTITEETLGSGNGRERQSLTLSQTPVLEGEKLYVRELETPSDEERQALEAMEQQQVGMVLTANEKAALVQTRENALTAEPEIWVRWHRVDTFYGSDAQSRHYVLDRITGVVSFGNGQQGMLPPIGRDNIRAFVYQAGGGRSASTETKVGVLKGLRSALPFVDTVTNVVAASGGSDPETVDDVLERGPQTIKNRDRAVTTEDYVWLAQQASTLVHRVKCLPTTRPTANQQLQFDPGSVTLLLLPEGEEPRPRPSQQLVREVRDELVSRNLSILKPTIFVLPPEYVEVWISAEVVPTVPEEASVVEGRIENSLRTFLHPVKGGPKRQGWEFGRNVYISEVYQLIEDTEGVDVVLSIVLSGDPMLQAVEIGDNQLPFSGTHDITMRPRASFG